VLSASRATRLSPVVNTPFIKPSLHSLTVCHLFPVGAQAPCFPVKCPSTRDHIGALYCLVCTLQNLGVPKGWCIPLCQVLMSPQRHVLFLLSWLPLAVTSLCKEFTFCHWAWCPQLGHYHIDTAISTEHPCCHFWALTVISPYTGLNFPREFSWVMYWEELAYRTVGLVKSEILAASQAGNSWTRTDATLIDKVLPPGKLCLILEPFTWWNKAHPDCTE
jgi:hypothetical protein